VGQVAQNFEAVVGSWPQPPIGPRPLSSTAATARLIPGSQANLDQQGAHETGARSGRSNPATVRVLPRLAQKLLPTFLTQVSPAMLEVLTADTLFLVVLWAVAQYFFSIPPGVPTAYVGLFLAAAMQEGVYKGRRSSNSVHIGWVRAGLWVSVITALALWCSSSPAHNQAVMLLVTVANVLLLCGWRWLLGDWAIIGRARARNVLVVGSFSRTSAIAEAIQSSLSNRRLKGVIREWQARVAFESLRRRAREEHIDEVILVADDLALVNTLLSDCVQNALDVSIAPSLPDSEISRVESLGDVVLLKVHQEQIPEWQLAIKRLIDVVLSVIFGVALSPLLCLTALLVKLDSRGPVLYPAVRIGRKGERFTCYKFRTMLRHSAALKTELRRDNERQGAFFKMSNDPRVTRVGRFLRRYSLDELPQLWNVLRGDMSLVGPRPHPVDDVDRYELHDLQRLDFTPGITGLWQITARDDPSFRRCVALDTEYIKRWSLGLDFQILCRTFGAVVRGSGV
jgi:exopolysaccharide biosynthesis polyprenyl glycosylphosphotransferase